MATLPKFVVLQSKHNNKYLQFVRQDGDVHGFLQFSGDKIISPYTKFQVEVSDSDNNLVHLKSCYNNKYWVAPSQPDNPIIAAADKPEEDQTKPSCTLFRPTFVDEKTVQLSHVSLGQLATSLHQPDQPKHASLQTQSSESQNNEFTIIDWSSLVILPKNVAFKIHNEDKYLSASPVNYENYLQFIADNMWDPTVSQEVNAADNGAVRIKSTHYGKYWKRDASSFILANSDNNTSNDLLFVAEKVVGEEANVIALRSSGNGDYCKRVSSGSVTNGLSAADYVITELSKLEVLELVISKSVHDLDFKLSDGKVSDTKSIVLDTKEVTNNSSETKDMEVKFEYSSTGLTYTWNSSTNASLNVGDKAAISSKIWFALEGTTDFKHVMDYMGNILWGVPQGDVGPVTKVYNVKDVPPMTKATVKAKGKTYSWEVPFSYIQTNTISIDGDQFSFAMGDGNYTGVYGVFVDYEIELTPVS